MREIKFRAWNGSAMEYGGFSIHATGKIQPLDSGITSVTKKSPVMQFTGLRDKNGTEIYEGDIISASDEGNRHHIAYCNNEARFLACYIPSVEYSDGCSLKAEWIALCGKIIIGNVRENPELLETP